MNIPAPYETLGLHDQIVWNHKKKQLNNHQQFYIKNIASVIEFLREKNQAFDLQTVTADELIEFGKTI